MADKLQIGQRTTALDLAQGLEGNVGTFHCQQSGQSYLAVAREGHSITSLRPVGVRSPVPAGMTQEPWTIEKISNQELSFEEAAGFSRR